jgi:antitoxin component of MazEF toxin-antitoxin module
MISIQVSIVQVGNSKGIRLSKTLLDKYKITNKVELILENDYIILQNRLPNHEKTGKMPLQKCIKTEMTSCL